MLVQVEPLIPALRRYARALVRDRSAADDLVQDCLERAVSRWHQRRDGSVRAWLFTILHNLAVSQFRQARARGRHMALMGVDTRRIYLITSAIGGGLAGLAACLLVLQYDVHPFVGLSFGPITFLICVLGGLGNFIGGFIAAFVFAEIISLGGLFSDLEWGYVLAFAFFIVMVLSRPKSCVSGCRGA